MRPNATPPLQIRRVSPADAPALQAYLAGLDAESRRLRFHGAVNPAAPSLLRRLTGAGADAGRHFGFVAVVSLADGDRIVGEAQGFVAPGGSSAEFAISVAAPQRGSGVAGELMAALQAVAAAAGVHGLHGEVLAGNTRMAAFLARRGFTPEDGADTEPGIVRFACRLAPAPAQARAAAGLPWWQRLLLRAAALPA